MRAASDNPQATGQEPAASARLSRLASLVTLVCLAGLAAEMGLWAYRRAHPPRHEHLALAPGTPFPAVVVTDLDGTAATLAPAAGEGTTTLLLLLTTNCPFCQANVPFWNEIYRAGGDTVRVIGLSLEDLGHTRTFVSTFGVEFPLQVVADEEGLRRQLRLRGVPQTLALDEAGVVRRSWIGGLTERMRRGVIEAMGELAPELLDSPAWKQQLAAAGRP